MRGRRQRRASARLAGLLGIVAVLLAFAALALSACGGGGAESAVSTSPSPIVTGSSGAVAGDGEGAAAEGSDVGAGTQAGARVTFIELGSDSCVPCKQMRPVMDALGRTFGDQLEIVYHDVWQDEAAARAYGVQYIPTQVFLDENGVEFHRHVGFYPEEQIEAMLLEHGLKKSGR